MMEEALSLSEVSAATKQVSHLPKRRSGWRIMLWRVWRTKTGKARDVEMGILNPNTYHTVVYGSVLSNIDVYEYNVKHGTERQIEAFPVV